MEQVRDSSDLGPGPTFSLIGKEGAIPIGGIYISVLVLCPDAGVRTGGGVGTARRRREGNTRFLRRFGQTASIGTLRQPIQEGLEPMMRFATRTVRSVGPPQRFPGAGPEAGAYGGSRARIIDAAILLTDAKKCLIQ